MEESVSSVRQRTVKKLTQVLRGGFAEGDADVAVFQSSIVIFNRQFNLVFIL